MSYDLEIVCSDLPSGEELEAARGSVMEGAILDGPFEVESGDVPEQALAHVLWPRWLIQVHVPYSLPARQQATARRVARSLASAFRGAVFDPQVDAILWPRGKPKRYIPPAEEERFRLVELEWFIPVSFEDALPEILIVGLRAECAEALPVRFGAFGPLQGRFDRENTESFFEAWRGERQEYGGHLFWDSTPPCLGGSVSFPDVREKITRTSGEVARVGPPGSAPAVRLSISWDGRALHGDRRWCETVVAAFRNLAQKTNAFYGAGYVNRNVIMKRGKVWYAADSESYALQRSRRWCGIPPKPTWLAWFGSPYRAAVKDFLVGAEDAAPGLMLRLGDEPMDLDQLTGKMPPIPSKFLAGHEQTQAIDAIADYFVPPAAWIPDLN